jgi:hypothetical protein
MALSTKHIVIRFYKKVYSTWDMALDGLILEYLLRQCLPFTLFCYLLNTMSSVYVTWLLVFSQAAS